MKLGRWYLGFRRHRPSRYAPAGWVFRSGGRATPGPWWELRIPRIGSLTLSHDRTLFGWGETDVTRID